MSNAQEVVAFTKSLTASHLANLKDASVSRILRAGLGKVYAAGVRHHFGKAYSVLPKLSVAPEFDAEQVWAQLSLSHSALLRECKHALASLKSELQREAAAAAAAGPSRGGKATSSRGRRDDDDDAPPPSSSRPPAAHPASAAKKQAASVDVDDMEAFVREGEAHMQRMMALKDGEEQEEEEDGPTLFDDIDFNAPVPDDEEGDGGGAADVARGSKADRIRALLQSAPTYADFFGSDDDEDADAAADAGGEGGSEDDDFIDHGMGGRDDDDDDDDLEEEDDDDEDEDGGHARAGKRGRGQMSSRADDDEDGMDMDDESGEEDAEDDREHSRRRMHAMHHPDEEEEDAGEDDAGPVAAPAQSRHAAEKARLAATIAQLEEEALADKPWLLKGEVTAGARPQNSLLEAHLDYDQAVKAAPVVTLETTATLEDVIKQRIADAAFDDPMPASEDSAPKKDGAPAADVSTEASKAGLAEIYEKEYQAAAASATTLLPPVPGGAAPGARGEAALTAAETEVMALLGGLFARLDALSNFNFTPKPVVRDVRVTGNTPAIRMEEVLPITVSDAVTRAPEEVHAPASAGGVLKSTGEMTALQRAAARRARKVALRKERATRDATRATIDKLNPGMGNPHAKAAAVKRALGKTAGITLGSRGGSAPAQGMLSGAAASSGSGNITSSTALFARLQAEARAQIYGGDKGESAAAAPAKSKGSAAAKFKL